MMCSCKRIHNVQSGFTFVSIEDMVNSAEPEFIVFLSISARIITPGAHQSNLQATSVPMCSLQQNYSSRVERYRRASADGVSVST